MPNYCENSLMIPIAVKKDFMRKFTRGQRARNWLNREGTKWSLDPVSPYLSLDRVLRIPTDMHQALIGRWMQDNWGCSGKGHGGDFFVHDGDEYDGKFEIQFQTAWAPLGERMCMEIANRLGCDVDHFYHDTTTDKTAIHRYNFEEDEQGVVQLFKRVEANDEDNIRTVLECFYGDSDYANEELERLLEIVK